MKANVSQGNFRMGNVGAYRYELRLGKASYKGIQDGRIQYLCLRYYGRMIALFRNNDWEIMPHNEKTLTRDLNVLRKIINAFNK